jgi:D-xylose transport system permease protein
MNASKTPPTMRRALLGELVALRAVIGLVLVCAIFQLQNANFLSSYNLTNLLLQVTATGLISVGVVFVLITGEIDLSVGIMSGLTAAVMAKTIVDNGLDPYLAMALAIAVGLAIGLFQGAVFTSFRVPSFVITLAGLLAWQGALLYFLGGIGTINVTSAAVLDLTGAFFSTTNGWLVGAGVIAIYAVWGLDAYRRLPSAERVRQHVVATLARISVVAAVVIGSVAVLNSDRGVPHAVVILLAFVALMQHTLSRTQFGRHVFAVGGNAEAARRAGIRVNRVRIAVFGIAGAMAAIGGIMAASRLQAVTASSGGSDLLLLAIAGPVIAGTSLFGGRGSVWSALIGALVIGAISNGMDLLAYEPSVKYMVTGAVLAGAVIVDSVTRRSSAVTTGAM